MKKIMIICLTFALTLTMLTACTQNQSGSQQDGQTAQEEPTQPPDLQEIVQAVKDAYGDNYLPSTFTASIWTMLRSLSQKAR